MTEAGARLFPLGEYLLAMQTIERPATPTTGDILARVGRPRATGAKRMLKLAGIGTLLLVGAGVTAIVIRARSAALPPRYLTSPLARGALSATVTATGTLRGKDTVSVGAETSGRVKKVNVDFNGQVTLGQVLAEIDPAPLQASLDQASAQLLAARADVKNKDATTVEARLTAERTRALALEGLASKQALEAAVAAADRAVAAGEASRAQVIVSEALVQSNQTALAKTRIRSPIDGVVLSRAVEPGQTLATAMTTPVLFTVAKDLRQMEVTIAIDEADVGRTRAGQHASFTVDAWPGRVFPGELHSIHNVAVTKDNVVTYEALLQVVNDELRLRPGMTATVTINTDERAGVLTVPNAALRFSPPSTEKRSMLDGPPGETPPPPADSKPHVWVLRAGKASEVVVETGLTDGVKTEVRAKALVEGEPVITDLEEARR